MTTAALIAVGGAANAADIYAPGSTKDVPVAPPLWTGLYFGVHVGGASADTDNHDRNDYLLNGAGWDWNNNTSGVLAGGQLGYNYQFGAFVIGAETDFGGVGLSNSWHHASPDLSVTTNDGAFYADITGRLGYALGLSLFYVKGGWAFLDSNATFNSIGGTPVTSQGISGWTIGGGIEYAFAPNWSVKAEYLYFDFSRNTIDWVAPNGIGYGFDRDITVNSFKVGVNYRVGSLYTPLK